MKFRSKLTVPTLVFFSIIIITIIISFFLHINNNYQLKNEEKNVSSEILIKISLLKEILININNSNNNYSFFKNIKVEKKYFNPILEFQKINLEKTDSLLKIFTITELDSFERNNYNKINYYKIKYNVIRNDILRNIFNNKKNSPLFNINLDNKCEFYFKRIVNYIDQLIIYENEKLNRALLVIRDSFSIYFDIYIIILIIILIILGFLFYRIILNLEAALSEAEINEIKYKNLFSFSPVPKIIYNLKSFKILKCNQAALNLFGYSESEMYQMKILDLVQEEVQNTAINILIDLNLNKNLNNSARIKLQTKDGKKLLVECNSMYIRFANIDARIVSIVDLTDLYEFDNKLSKAIFETQEKERFEIGAELHDNANQLLTAALIDLSSIVKYEQVSKINSVKNHITEVIKINRNLSHKLALPLLNRDNFYEQILNLISSYNQLYKIKFVYSLSENYYLSDLLITHLYRIIQEQLVNIKKYSKATTVEISLHNEEGFLILFTSDNGIGFELDKIKNGIGLLNMQKRVSLFLGELNINTAPDKGCAIEIKIPSESKPSN
ncbi:PAS domain-containing sensor histidine kinase [Hydrotalea sandarakina]|jgi:PAS domain S-box-containing protein|uniref:histidine kinase n=1 Tax=Hydrotalea sandarakina TaxID=1004304 RepID=A0A2W7S3X0_9BACT|nr:PAS domain-containing protein [Hydrotalea sandarakina]PZX65796.1 PAS domain S-box-containing protein [Hydrotalea sandarakina]